MKSSIVVASFTLVISLSWATTARAWGPVGHETVAYIAEQNITPATRDAVARILGEGETMADVAPWADQYRLEHKETAPWHFIDIPITGTSNESEESKYCVDSNCVVDQIDKDVEVLKSDKFSQDDKVLALKYLIHFVGDVHQPLHCANDDDRGGNEKYVRLKSSTSKRATKGTLMDLHAVWDRLIEVKTSEDPSELATELDSATSDAQKAAWRSGTAADWAWESYGYAKKIYAPFPHGPMNKDDAKQLPDSYYSTDDKPSEMRSLVNQRLEQAGVRLAWLLDQIFAGQGTASADENTK